MLIIIMYSLNVIFQYFINFHLSSSLKVFPIIPFIHDFHYSYLYSIFTGMLFLSPLISSFIIHSRKLPISQVFRSFTADYCPCPWPCLLPMTFQLSEEVLSTVFCLHLPYINLFILFLDSFTIALAFHSRKMPLTL